MPHYKLTYFSVTSLGEPIRFLFAYGGIQYEDNRLVRANFSQIKDSMPFGQVPILEVDGKRVNQSAAIARYVAKLVGLAGKDDWEALEIDATVDNIYDMRSKLTAFYYEKDPKTKEAKQELAKELVPMYLERLDAQVKKNGGYFVGGVLTWADLTFVALLEVLDMMSQCNTIENYENLKKLTEKVLAIPSIKNWVATRPPSVITR